MCLAVPARIVQQRDDQRAVADLCGSRLEISTLLTPNVGPGDWVLLHTGFAIQTLTPQAAERLMGELTQWSHVAPTQNAVEVTP